MVTLMILWSSFGHLVAKRSAPTHIPYLKFASGAYSVTFTHATQLHFEDAAHWWLVASWATNLPDIKLMNGSVTPMLLAMCICDASQSPF